MRTILWCILYTLINIAWNLNPEIFISSQELLEGGDYNVLAVTLLIALVGDFVNFMKNLR